MYIYTCTYTRTHTHTHTHTLIGIGSPGAASCREPTCQCRTHKRLGFNLWVGETPWGRAWQLTPVFLPGESHGKRNLVGYSPWGCKESEMTEWLTHTIPIYIYPVFVTTEHWLEFPVLYGAGNLKGRKSVYLTLLLILYILLFTQAMY